MSQQKEELSDRVSTLPIYQKLFDRVSDGVFVLSVDSTVLYANPVAQEMLSADVGAVFPMESVRRGVAALRKGYLQGEQHFAFELSPDYPDSRVEAVLEAGLADSEYLLLVRSAADRRRYENALANFAEMLDCSFKEPCDKFVAATERMFEQFERAGRNDWNLSNAVDQVRVALGELQGEIREVQVLASAFSASPMVDDQRIEIPGLLAEAFASARSAMQTHGLKLCFAGIDDSLPILYGSRLFLTQALAGYVRHLSEHVQPRSYLLAAVERRPGTVTISLTNYGDAAAGFPSQLPELPFVLTATPDGIAPVMLTLPICRRIVELHRGTLSVESERGRIRRIGFELPVGDAPLNDSELGMKQAVRYAQDLRRLIQKSGDVRPAARGI